MVGPHSCDGEIVSQTSGLHTMGTHELHPWMEEVGNNRHAEWAALRDATLLPVGLAKPFSDGVVVLDVLVEVPVGHKDAQRETSNLQEEVDELSLNLVKALPDVCTSSSNVLAAELRKFKVERSEVPGVFSARGSSRPSIELRVFP